MPYLLLFLGKCGSQSLKEAEEDSAVDAIGQGTSTHSPANKSVHNVRWSYLLHGTTQT